jgi:glycosyltransferase involved in cell wall biosynthesis
LFYAGRLYYNKGILHLLQILTSLADEFGGVSVSLNIFGSGPLEQALRRHVDTHLTKMSVTIRGQVDHTTLLRELSGSDIVCLPSFYEACSVMMIEAVSMGKPVLAFNLPFAREILGDTDDLLASDVHDYGVKLKRLICSPQERVRLGRRLLERAERFDAPKIASKYQEVYNELA